MEEARKVDLRPLLAVAAVVALIATLWATGAFAAGGSSSSGDSPGSVPPAFVQDEQAPSREDCPEDRGGSGGGDQGDGAPQGDSDGSGSPDL
jgi:transcription elongation factor